MAPSLSSSPYVSLSSAEIFHHEHVQSPDMASSTSPVSTSYSSQLSDCSSTERSELNLDEETSPCSSFLALRLHYILVNLVVMLADGLQGTHMYVLYESYGFSAASLYCTGFVAGAITAPITGPLIDKFGRKKSALIYCILEIGINMLEQYPFLVGIVLSRIVGGITTNLLSSVFETWLDTEYRRRGFEQAHYELIMRDSVVVKNLAAVASGYLAHILAEHAGPVGPFQGAVVCTAVALVVILVVWTENYGCGGGGIAPKSLTAMMKDTVTACRADSQVLRVGIIQGLTMATLLIFVFIWVPLLQGFSKSAPAMTIGLDRHGEPAYGLIFGAFMAAGVLGGLISPYFRRAVALLFAPFEAVLDPDIEREDGPMAVEIFAAGSYTLASILLLVPCIAHGMDPMSFSSTLGAFVLYELLIGLYLPCEGVIRSLYIPSDSRASLMTVPHVVVNVLVFGGIISTKFLSMQTVSGIISGFMAIAAVLQLSLVSQGEWDGLSGRLGHYQKKTIRPVRALSLSAMAALHSRVDKAFQRSPSTPSSEVHRSCSYQASSARLLGEALAEVRDWANEYDEDNRRKLKEA